MKKKLIIGFLPLFIGSVGALSYWEGTRAETQWQLLTERAISSLPPGKAEATYHRGWFRSSAEFRLQLGPHKGKASAGEELPDALVLHNTLIHGPFPLLEMIRGKAPRRPVLGVVHTRLALEVRSSTTGKVHREEFHEARMDTILDLDGGGKTDIHMSPCTSKDDARGESLVAKELRGTVTFTPWAEQVEAEITWEGAELVLRNVRVTLGRTASTFSYRGSRSRLERWKDTHSVEMLRAEWGPKGSHNITFRDLSFVASQADNEGNLETQFLAKVKELSGFGQQLGPALFEANMYRLDHEALEKLDQWQHAARKKQKNGSLKDLADSQNKELNAILTAILRKSPELDIRLEVGTAKGMIRASSKALFDGSDETRLRNPPLWSTAIDVDFKLSIPAALLEGTPQQLPTIGASQGMQGPGRGAPTQRHLPFLTNLLAARGYRSSTAGVFLVRNGDRFESHVTCRHGHVLVNGWPLELLSQRTSP